MSNKKFYWLMVGVNCIVVVAIIASVVVGDRLLKKQSDTILAQKLENSVLEKEQVSVLTAKQDLEKYAELQQIAKQIVPQEKDQALTTRQIVTLADKSSVHIGSIGFPSSTLGNAATKKSADSTAPSPTVSGISQAKPVAGINNLLALDISVVSDTTKPSGYSNVINFLQSLENNRRTAQVSQINIQPDSKNTSLLNFSLTLTVYIKQ